MKWFWWIGGAVAYLVLKNEVGIDSPGMWVVVVVVLVAATLLGQTSDTKGKKRAQDERDRAAAEAANDALNDHRALESQKQTNEPEK